MLSIGHHIDHVVRGNHTGWPVTSEVTPFSASLAVYPLVLLGLVLSRTKRPAAGYWLVLTGSGTLFLLAVHLGPAALEPPGDVIGAHRNSLLGWAAFAWRLSLIAVLFATFLYTARRWSRQRNVGRRRG